MITGKQVVAARGLLDISQEDLAAKAGVGLTTLRKFEKEMSDTRTPIKNAIEKTLIDLGIEFKEGGVIPRKIIVDQISGANAYDKLEDDIFDKIKDLKSEILLYGIDEIWATEHNQMHAKRLQDNNISQKNITRSGAKTFLFPKECYRFLGEDIFTLTPFAIYSDNLAIVYPDLNSGKDHVIIIRNSSLAEAFKKQFEHFWKIGKKE